MISISNYYNSACKDDGLAPLAHGENEDWRETVFVYGVSVTWTSDQYLETT